MERSASQIDLPGFRFHPTEEELLDFYLRRAVTGKKLNLDIITTINLYLYDPWDLPAFSKIGEKEWYFFVPRDRRQGNGGRPNRTTERGFWKATGSDRPIRSAADPRRLIGLKKTLVYYLGRAPRGNKTEWVMNEYRLPELSSSAGAQPSPPKEDIVLCKVYKKATSQRELEQRAAMEEESRATTMSTSSGQEIVFQNLECNGIANEEVEMQRETSEVDSSSAFFAPVSLLEASAVKPLPPSPEPTPAPRPVPETTASRPPINLPAIQVPSHAGFEWMQDPFVNQLRSPWLEQWSPLYAQLLNF
ncbi:hypothetical protein HPP92_001446 [Vanilla planifolia]|uniref:NAC domain-containing protein n=1 Tax=Vanilla planifolia TaxID=51239 RepID=A0A835RR78_VANPL|nr:hypothetical protein HPP92_001736 [Vanilla planifolia]KAG0501374.1 hypothetical protein HPP92_001446 [Vanilla planifolia]